MPSCFSIVELANNHFAKEVIDKMIQHDQLKRPRRVSEVVQALESIVSEEQGIDVVTASVGSMTMMQSNSLGEMHVHRTRQVIIAESDPVKSNRIEIDVTGLLGKGGFGFV